MTALVKAAPVATSDMIDAGTPNFLPEQCAKVEQLAISG